MTSFEVETFTRLMLDRVVQLAQIAERANGDRILAMDRSTRDRQAVDEARHAFAKRLREALDVDSDGSEDEIVLAVLALRDDAADIEEARRRLSDAQKEARRHKTALAKIADKLSGDVASKDDVRKIAVDALEEEIPF